MGLGIEGNDHDLEEDSAETKKHRIRTTLLQLEKAKQKPVAFSVRAKLGFIGERYTDNDAPLPAGTKDLCGNLRDYLVTFESKDYLHIIEKFNNDWWIGHRYSGGGISSHHGSDLDLNSQAAHEEYSRPAQLDNYDYDMDPKDTGPLNLGKKSQRLGKKEQPYVVVPNMRPVVFVGPSLKGYEVTDMMQKALFDYLKKKFEGRCNIVRISSDLSQARRNMPRTEENRAICEDYDRIYELGKNLQLVILDCDMINNPSQLEKTGLMPINVFIKINDPEVLKRLIRWRGRQQMRHMSVQWMAAEKLCQCDPNVFDVCLDENVFEEACEHLTEYLEAYWNATHPVLPEATHPKELLNGGEITSNLPNVLTKLIPRNIREKVDPRKYSIFSVTSDEERL